MSDITIPMQFKVPQFLDIEDKLFGPFTFSEFVYLAGGGGICYILYKALGFFWGAIPIMAVAGFAVALTFYKPNNKPFINMLESGIKYLIQDKLYIWKRAMIKKSIQKEKELESAKEKTVHNNPRLGGNKLRDLAWSLDVLDLKKEKN